MPTIVSGRGEVRGTRSTIGSFAKVKRAVAKVGNRHLVTEFVAHVCCDLKDWPKGCLKDHELCLTHIACLLLYEAYVCTRR
jgi:hypothetical protein